MPSLNQIATSILNEVNQTNNHELLERIKDRARFLRATILKRNMDKYRILDSYVIPLVFKLEDYYNINNCSTSNTNCIVKITTNNVPIPIHGSYRPVFKYVGSDISNGKHIPYYLTMEHNILPLMQLPMYKNTTFAVYSMNKVKVYGSNATRVRVDMVVSDMTAITSDCSEECHSDDDEFLVPYDVIDSIITTLVNEFIKVNNPNSNYEVNIDKIDSQTLS